MIDRATMPQEAFKAYLFHNRRNRIILCIVLTAVIIQFAVFKYFYPYANYLHEDSFKYLAIAYKNSNIGTLPVGYARFIRFFSVFTNSDLALTAFQYLLLQCSALYLLFTLFYFYRLGKLLQVVLLCFMVLNPLFLYLANLVSSDGFFLSLSFIWFTFLLWIIHRPSKRLIVWHTLVLFIAFTVRYNALIYPLISIAAFALSRQTVGKKLIGIGAGLLVCGLFVLYTGNKFKSLTGTWQYAPLSGWLIANNALQTYRYVDSAKRKSVPLKFKSLDNVIRTYFDSSRRSDSKIPMGLTLYIYPPELFLNIYRDKRFKGDTISSDLKKLASVAPLYGDYGRYIIRQYPSLYVQHVLWPNGWRYFAPSVESLASYNAGTDSINPIARIWFGYKQDRLKVRTEDLQITLLDWTPIFSGIVNILMPCCLLCFAVMGGFKKEPTFRNDQLLVFTLWLLNAALIIFATSAILRYEVFSILLTTCFTLIVVERILKVGLNASKEIEVSNNKIELSTAELG